MRYTTHYFDSFPLLEACDIRKLWETHGSSTLAEFAASLGQPVISWISTSRFNTTHINYAVLARYGSGVVPEILETDLILDPQAQTELAASWTGYVGMPNFKFRQPDPDLAPAPAPAPVVIEPVPGTTNSSLVNPTSPIVNNQSYIFDCVLLIIDYALLIFLFSFLIINFGGTPRPWIRGPPTRYPATTGTSYSQ